MKRIIQQKSVRTRIAAIILLLLLPFGFSGSVLAAIVDIGPRTEAVDLARYQSVYFVAPGATAGEGSREKPWRTPAVALAAISGASAQRRTAVLVAVGVYDDDTVVMKEWIDLYGGFDPVTWERDIDVHRSVLDGRGLRRVVLGSDRARIDGFVIRNGLSRSHGGGILCWDTSPEISNNRIIDNLALEPAEFDATHIHQAGHHGGGIASFYNAVPVIRNNLIARNRTAVGVGGGVAFHGWLRRSDVPEPELKDDFISGGLQPELKNNILIANESGAADFNRTRSSSGGAVSCAYEARPLIAHNVILSNRARGRSDAGGVYAEFYAFPVIEDNWIVGNISDDDGGGLYAMRAAHPLIRRNYIAGNWTTGNGAGGLRLSKEGRGRIVDNVIVRNLSGGGVNCTDSWMEMEDNVVMHNRGGGLTFIQHYRYWPAVPVRRNVIRDNEGPSIILGANVDEPLQLENNNLQGTASRSNRDTEPGFPVRSWTVPVVLNACNGDEYSATLMITALVERTDQWAGAVVRIGDVWGVVQSVNGSTLRIWSGLDRPIGSTLELEVLPSYRLR